MTFDEWATRWALHPQAIAELIALGTEYSTPEDQRSEAYATSAGRRELGNRGIISMRNNVGALEDSKGRVVRFGLMNESEKVNKTMKSSDEILIIPYRVKAEDVGRKLGLFGAIEFKRPSWVYSGEGREGAQLNFIRMVQAAGGFATFANGPKMVIDSLVSHGLVSS
jgi:hypothetical protein